MQDEPQGKTASHRGVCAYREATKQAAGEWVSLSVKAWCLLSEMGEQEQVDRQWLATLARELACPLCLEIGQGRHPTAAREGRGTEMSHRSVWR